MGAGVERSPCRRCHWCGRPVRSDALPAERRQCEQVHEDVAGRTRTARLNAKPAAAEGEEGVDDDRG
jgi:hypothetical protein